MSYYSLPKSSFPGKISEGSLKTWPLKVTLAVSAERASVPQEHGDSPLAHLRTLLSSVHILSSSCGGLRYKEKHSCPKI